MKALKTEPTTMKNENYLKIKNPCEQRWSSMQASQKGKFCRHCEKTVIDFSLLSDDEILKIMKKSSGKVCGRFTNQQLNRPLLNNHQRSKWPPVYKLLSGLFFLGISANAISTNIKIPTEIMNRREEDYQQPHKKAPIKSCDTTKNKIHGRVIDQDTKEPLPDVSVIIKDSKIATTTNSEGVFTFLIPDELLTNKITVTIASVGYTQKDIVVKKNQLPIQTEFILCQIDQALFGEVVIVKKKKWWQREKNRNTTEKESLSK